jgi:uncharacterized membrane protein YqgA involved in biofilm formation
MSVLICWLCDCFVGADVQHRATADAVMMLRILVSAGGVMGFILHLSKHIAALDAALCAAHHVQRLIGNFVGHQHGWSDS